MNPKNYLFMMLPVMLPQQILAVVIAVGGADDSVDMLACRSLGTGQGNGALVVKFNQHHGTLDTVIKNAVLFRAAHPAEVRGIEMFFHIGHFHFGVSIGEIPDVHFNEPMQLRFLFDGQLAAANADVIEHLIVAKRFTDIISRAFVDGDDRFGALGFVQ